MPRKSVKSSVFFEQRKPQAMEDVMRMPGFTAEVGFREATTNYRASVAASPHNGAVVPAYLCYVCGFNIYHQWECGWSNCYQSPKWPA
jgi:hypothetical protein